MFGYEILRNKWAWIVLFGGVALVIYSIVFLLDYWKKRKLKDGINGMYETEYMTAWQAMPWTVKITIAVIVVFGIIFSISQLTNPTSW